MMPNDNALNHHDAPMAAEAVIERFGGIRPMATKMGVPVTTVQGWKKRNLIPGNRRDDVMKAAQKHAVDLSGLGSIGAGDFSTTLGQAAAEQDRDPAITRRHDDAIAAARLTEMQEQKASPGLTHEVMMKEIKKAQTRATQRAVIASGALLGVFAIIFGMLIAMNKQQVAMQTKRITLVEDKIDTIDTVDPAYEGMPRGVVETMMQDVQQKMFDLRQKTEKIQASVTDLKTQAESFMNLENSSLVDRIMALEQTLGGLSGGNTDLSMVLNRITTMQNSLQGQEKMQATVNQLQNMVAAMQGQTTPESLMGPPTMDQMLAAEQKEGDSELAQTLEGVSPAQLKAAALLIGLSQFRDSMNRSGPFANDLALLQTMMGERDPELNQAIAQLAPYAEKGVLSPQGLSEELKTLTGEIAVASMTGQDLSVQDRAMARFQEILKIQKDGQPVMGTDAQARVARAQLLLDAGDVSGAIAELESLDGPAREKAQPVIDQAQVTAMAQKVQGMLTNNVMGQIKSGLSGGGASYIVKPALQLPSGIPGAGFIGPSAPKVYTPPRTGE